jgi:hypothetical protein
MLKPVITVIILLLVSTGVWMLGNYIGPGISEDAAYGPGGLPETK